MTIIVVISQIRVEPHGKIYLLTSSPSALATSLIASALASALANKALASPEKKIIRMTNYKLDMSYSILLILKNNLNN